MPRGVYIRPDNISDITRRNALCRKISNKGMKYNISEESHKRMSDAKKGHIPWNKGKPDFLTKEQREKLNDLLRTKKVPLERRIRIANSMRGDKSPNWKGGITKEYRIVRECMEYRLWRESVYKRDNYCCRICGDHNYEGRGSSLKIHAHHIKPFAKFPELRFAIDNGLTLCEPCHKNIHRKK